jgi:hypothetical protein
VNNVERDQDEGKEHREQMRQEDVLEEGGRGRGLMLLRVLEKRQSGYDKPNYEQGHVNDRPNREDANDDRERLAYAHDDYRCGDWLDLIGGTTVVATN